MEIEQSVLFKYLWLKRTKLLDIDYTFVLAFGKKTHTCFSKMLDSWTQDWAGNPRGQKSTRKVLD
jgi:hypothetical protein